MSPSERTGPESDATRKTPLHSGGLAIGTFQTSGNPQGNTLVLELQ